MQAQAEGRATSLARLLHDMPRHPAAPAMSGEALKPQQRVADDSKTYLARHERTQPPASQVVTTETQNALLRQFRARAESRQRQKRAIGDAKDESHAKRRDRGSEARSNPAGDDG